MCVGMIRNWKRVIVFGEKEEVWHIYFSTVINRVERLITISRSLRLLLLNFNQKRKSTCSHWLRRGFLHDDFILIMLRFLPHAACAQFDVASSTITIPRHFLFNSSWCWLLVLSHFGSVIDSLFSQHYKNIMQNVTFDRRYFMISIGTNVL